MVNKKLGNSFENELCKILFKHGYWCHNFTQNQAGQPADVIAVKGGVPYLIDCKVCTQGEFSIRRIEDNQRSAMSLWEASGNGCGWFAVSFLETKQIYFVSLMRFEQTDRKNLNEWWFKENGYTLADWLAM